MSQTYYFYILKCSDGSYYSASTTNLENRIKAHNKGRSPHTAKHKPWTLVTYQSFSEKNRAHSFEPYLKSHSGKAFANKRLG
jgi:predicted GIY-YIG superfamily endonuclease